MKNLYEICSQGLKNKSFTYDNVKEFIQVLKKDDPLRIKLEYLVTLK